MELLVFLLQALLFIVYIPASYIAYRSARVPLKQNRIEQSLLQLGVDLTPELKRMITQKYHPKHFYWPLFLACLLTFIIFAFTHPYVIQSNLWVGLLEQEINIFKVADRSHIPFLAGRFLFWSWVGAYTYSFHLTFRRFMAYDLTPNVYIFTSNRFALAFAVSSIVGLGVGTFSNMRNSDIDYQMTLVSIISFFIGFFPEQGLRWIWAIVKRIPPSSWLSGNFSKEILLSEIEGLSLWQQGRLEQEGIDNVQNLAMADLPTLIINTPFTVSQIIDWVDQALLIIYASEAQLKELDKVGLRCASDVLTASGDDKRLDQLATVTGLNKDGLRMLRLALQSAPNIQIVSRFGWERSVDEERRKEAVMIHSVPILPV